MSYSGVEKQRLRNHHVGIAEAYWSDRDALDSGLSACAALTAIRIAVIVEWVAAGG